MDLSAHRLHAAIWYSRLFLKLYKYHVIGIDKNNSKEMLGWHVSGLFTSSYSNAVIVSCFIPKEGLGPCG